MRTVDPGFLARLGGSRLTTAEQLYDMPDHPTLRPSFLCQTREFDALIDSVRIAHRGLVHRPGGRNRPPTRPG
ncbi:hypothetical protein [Maricaulis maris]|uniref:Uncharacterized protein Usg n=1 Tax=Maricaulis maris TaxID=74318 RepID=A0A495D2J5_9PROT|nr:hypothetical protein [Maricaulis maris]RKQ95999.1 uncharacterized protein Usg [Maricaulis maris]